MTPTEHPSQDLAEPARLAADARSILACPATVSLVIDGEEHAVGEDEVGITDHRGVPTFLCRAGSPVGRAAVGHRSALLTLSSGLGPRGGSERDATVTIAGRLEHTGFEDCECCDEVRHVVSLDASFVLLERSGRQHPVPLQLFRSREHALNRGHLQRSVEHANDCHQDELRRALALGTGTRPGDLIGVRLGHLTASGVELQWVDVAGAHRTVLTFPRTARDLAELGELLRRGLHAGIC